MTRRRDRGELGILLIGIAAIALTWSFIAFAGEVSEGDMQKFDVQILKALRKASDPAVPIGPAWMTSAVLDITALGSATVLGLVIVAVLGFLLLQARYRTALFVFVSSGGGWLLNSQLKQAFARPRPVVVPHLREAMTMSFPSGHALTSAVVYLTLGALLMRLAERRLVKIYCIGVAMFATFLVGMSRLFLGVHYPTDVLAGWMVGLTWALICWMVERAIERQSGIEEEQKQG